MDKSVYYRRLLHILHCCLYLVIIIAYQVQLAKDSVPATKRTNFFHILPWLFSAISVALVLPVNIFNFLGLVCFNAFPYEVKLKSSPCLAPYICIRVVTRGDCPELVKDNVERNLKSCFNVGLRHFEIEVVTQKALNIFPHPNVKETVVPPSYKTKAGSLYKARNLQYCLEDSVNTLRDSDWIVHLDEDTLVTDDSVRGIVNFVTDGQYPIGQGMITYTDDVILNWFTTLWEAYTTSYLMGAVRFQFRVFHRPLFGWTGSFVVIRTDVEKDVTFDHGLEGSVAEDTFFAMIADKKGYKFNFVEGEMLERSAISILEFIRQRKRYLLGQWLVLQSSAIPLQQKVFFSFTFFSAMMLPLSYIHALLCSFFSIYNLRSVNVISTFIFTVYLYNCIYPIMLSRRFSKMSFFKYSIALIGAVCSSFLYALCFNVVISLFCFDRKDEFYVTKKVKRK